jgi:hypothetical protein
MIPVPVLCFQICTTGTTAQYGARHPPRTHNSTPWQNLLFSGTWLTNVHQTPTQSVKNSAATTIVIIHTSVYCVQYSYLTNSEEKKSTGPKRQQIKTGERKEISTRHNNSNKAFELKKIFGSVEKKKNSRKAKMEIKRTKRYHVHH